MGTLKLFYESPRLTEFTASVVGVQDGEVILDRTGFYPRGGHQDADRGTLSWGDRSAAVCNVVSDGDRVAHLLDAEPPPLGTSVVGRIDWARRWYLSRLHSAQHVASRLIADRWNIRTERSDFTAEGGLLVLASALPEGAADELEARFDDVVSRALPVRRELDGDRIDLVIEGFDRDMCGGTHVECTAQLGGFVILDVDHRKTFFDIGEVGFGRLRTAARRLRAVGRALDTEPTPAAVEAMRRELVESRARTQTLCREQLERMLREDGDVSRHGGVAVKRVHVAELDARPLKAALKVLTVGERVADVYLISTATKAILLSFTAALSAKAWLDRLKESQPAARGGGGPSRAEVRVVGLPSSSAGDALNEQLRRVEAAS